MNISEKTKITVSIGLIATIVSFCVYTTVVVVNHKNNIQNQYNTLEQTLNQNIMFMSEKLNQKADKMEVNSLNIKMENVEKILLEIKEDVKEIKRM